MPAILWLVFGGITLTIGDIVFKFWVERPTVFSYISGLCIYLIGLMCLVQSYKTENIAIASAIFVIFNIVTLALVSWFYFNDKLSTMQMIGIFLAIIAVVILELHTP